MKAHHNGHEHEFEPQFGLPERLPGNERVLWQGTPSRTRIAHEVFHLRAIAIYFATIIVLRFVFHYHDTGSVIEALANATWLLPVFGTGLALLWGLAHGVARTTVYTITDRRVVMRVGIVLSLTFNLPFARIRSAQVARRGPSGGDIVLELVEGDKIAWAHLWPHLRPWCFTWPQPMLRGLDEVEAPAGLLRDAWLASRQQADGAALVTGFPEVGARMGEPHDPQRLAPAGGPHVAAH